MAIIITTEKLNMSSSPDGSKYPFVSSSNEIKDIVDSGSEADEKPNTSAPKKQKTAACCHNAVLKNGFCLFIRVPAHFDS